MLQWVTHRHVRHQCSGHSAQVFPLKRCKDAHLAGTVVYNVSLCCCGDAATLRARQVLAQHAPSCWCLKQHAILWAILSGPGGRSSGIGRETSPAIGL